MLMISEGARRGGSPGRKKAKPRCPRGEGKKSREGRRKKKKKGRPRHYQSNSVSGPPARTYESPTVYDARSKTMMSPPNDSPILNELFFSTNYFMPPGG